MKTVHPRPTASGSKGRGLSRLIGLALVAAVAISATPSALLVAVLLLPTVLAWIADRQPGRPCARVVMLFGAAAACPDLDRLWQLGNELDVAIVLATDIRQLAIAWAGQAGGWLLIQLLVFVSGQAADARNTLTSSRLMRRRETLLAEWQDGKT